MTLREVDSALRMISKRQRGRMGWEAALKGLRLPDDPGEVVQFSKEEDAQLDALMVAAQKRKTQEHKRTDAKRQ